MKIKKSDLTHVATYSGNRPDDTVEIYETETGVVLTRDNAGWSITDRWTADEVMEHLESGEYLDGMHSTTVDEREEYAMKYTHKITEAGNGLPSEGAQCYDASTDELLEVKSTSRIHTQSPGMGNYVWAVCEVIGDAQTLSDEEFDDLTDYGVQAITEEETEI